MTEGRLLGGRYRLGELLGYGGMAEVHRGHDSRLNRDVAVKVLRADLARDTAFQARFRREAKNAASLNHPAIVAVFDTGEADDRDGGLPFIVMEYVAGRTLRDVLNDEGRLMPERALEIVADVCAALDFSHRNGIIHRDVKPGNVMLTPDGAVKVMDFGIARALASSTVTMTQTSAVIGTAQYLSPEQARGEPVDARSDVYSTGCMLYELLVGEPPFSGDNPVAVAYQHVREDPVTPSDHNPDITPDMDAVVLKAMAKNPANRYQSAAEMRVDLLRAAARQPVAATPVLSAAERTEMAAMPTVGPAPGPGDAPPGRQGVARGLVVLTVVLVFSVVALGTAFLLARADQRTVPSLVGQTRAEAETLLTAEDLLVEVTPVVGTFENEGEVLTQDPAADVSVEQGSTVVIGVSAGPDAVPVPNLAQLSQADAETQLRERELTARVEPVDGPAGTEGQVLSSEPGAGQQVPVGSVVAIRVSRGNLVPVPGVVGRQQADAERELTDAGFDVRVQNREDGDRPAGEVVSQDPPAGGDVARGATVTIVVASSPPPPPPPSPTPSPSSPSPSPSGSASPSVSASASVSPPA